MKYYAGIGSRETPNDICLYMTTIAKKLAKLGYTCNSGGADGADSAFERGAVINRQIFLPWDGFNGKYIENMNKFWFVMDKRPQMKDEFDKRISAHRRVKNIVSSININSDVLKIVHQYCGLD